MAWPEDFLGEGPVCINDKRILRRAIKCIHVASVSLFWRAWDRLLPVDRDGALAMIRLAIPIGRTPGFLFKAMRRQGAMQAGSVQSLLADRAREWQSSVLKEPAAPFMCRAADLMSKASKTTGCMSGGSGGSALVMDWVSMGSTLELFWFHCPCRWSRTPLFCTVRSRFGFTPKHVVSKLTGKIVLVLRRCAFGNTFL